MTTPITHLEDTATLESAMQRVERQFKLDGLQVIRTELVGNGRFIVYCNITSHVYEWSHATGTRRIY